MNEGASSEKATKPIESIKDLIFRGVKVPAIATAIEKNGIFTWDRYGRFIKAKVGDEGAEVLETQEFALKCLADCVTELTLVGIKPPITQYSLGDLIQLYGKWPEKSETCRYLKLYGWIRGEVPDFQSEPPRVSRRLFGLS